MTFLDLERLSQIDPSTFQSQKPYPWINPGGLLTEEGYRRLREALPDVSELAPDFGRHRMHGQRSHDRFSLEYSDELDVDDAWKEFASELRDQPYRDFLSRMLGVRRFGLNFHWHYTPNGCSVSPHCDARRKLGSHIFYLNTEDDWDPAWGGETLVLDDGGEFRRNTAPQFDDFTQVMPSRTVGNHSFLFAQTTHSWHGVREIRCPKDRLRKVFIVVVNRHSPIVRARRWFRKMPTWY